MYQRRMNEEKLKEMPKNHIFPEIYPSELNATLDVHTIVYHQQD
jgi:hypothetical protein